MEKSFILQRYIDSKGESVFKAIPRRMTKSVSKDKVTTAVLGVNKATKSCTESI